MEKAKAVVEVVIVFGLTLLLIALVSLSPISRWERQVTNWFFVEYGVMIVFPLLLLVASHRNLAAYGLSLRNVSYHLDIAATAFVPVAIASAAIAFVDYREWSGSLILAAVQIAVLFALGWLLKRKPTANDNGSLLSTVLPIACLNLTLEARVGNALSAFVFYVFFVGLGEELLFRGYIQSRLNAAFGKPFRFFGVNWGWGIVITAALFGLMHILNIGSLVIGRWELAWWWGLWTFFGGLVLGFVREKSFSIIAPTILHGLPQAIAHAVLGL
ncbi:MAG TPA: CPBP family intramembrane metalloprotease [Anaerolineae bacterium]|nr:CPBP family intramembrane metalloprotease [Anaerolineae bacterium]HQK13258.1 CPBP family intramembrane metalloprotease [Anaerolineae bacterium]